MARTFADLLRRAPERKGLTQEQVVARLCEHGVRVAQTTVSAWERGAAVPRARKRLEAIAAVYGIPMDVVVDAIKASGNQEPLIQATSRGGRGPTSYDEEADWRDSVARLEETMAEILRILRENGGNAPGGAPPSSPRGGRGGGSVPPGVGRSPS